MFSILIVLTNVAVHCGRGRFKSCLAQTEDYVLACYRYIELNPVRAQMVKHPRDYEWSSYRVNAENLHSDLITPHERFIKLHVSQALRNRAYRSLFEVHLDADINSEIRVATNGNSVLGNQKFQKEIEQALGR